MIRSAHIPRNLTRYLLPSILIVVFIGLLFQTAWVSDDAFITFRSVENFIHGYGPVFNIGERVQTFTHPLWFFLQSAANIITQRFGALNAWGQMYYVNIGLSVLISILVALLVAFGIARSTRGAVLSLLILILSKAFVDYSTSGLENALTNLILALFLLIYLRNDENTPIKLLLLAFLAGLAGLNRFDTLLLYLPAIGLLVWQSRKKVQALLLAVLGLSPFFLWELFSLFYYGVPFPNTAYAKLNTGISQWSMFRQGGAYFLNSLKLDPLTLLVIAATLVVVFYTRNKRHLPVAIGILAYLAYILYIGGDFMSGRYFAAPLLASVCLLSTFDFQLNRAYGAALGAVLFAGLLPIFLIPARSPFYVHTSDFREMIDSNGISDERVVYYSRLGLLSPNRKNGPIGSSFAGAKWVFHPDEPVTVKVVGPLGVAGYQAGPNVHMLDYNALADPLMTRLPLEDNQNWRIGHFRHIIPEGYLETLSSGINQIQDPEIARFYEQLRLVTRGKLFDPSRLRAIWDLNTGKYNGLIRP